LILTHGMAAAGTAGKQLDVPDTVAGPCELAAHMDTKMSNAASGQKQPKTKSVQKILPATRSQPLRGFGGELLLRQTPALALFPLSSRKRAASRSLFQEGRPRLTTADRGCLPWAWEKASRYHGWLRDPLFSFHAIGLRPTCKKDLEGGLMTW
jgi:hypothetical protein